VQSRIANDIGGVENVVTNTATSIVSNLTTVLATVVAMFLLDWRLAAFSLALLPLFVWLTRRVGAQRKRITTQRQETMADMSTLVEESLSVSGILLGKTMGRSAALAERFGSGPVMAGGFLFVAAIAYPGGMGMGDVKLAFVMGLFLGRDVAPAIFIGLVAGTVVGVVIMALKGVKAGRKTAVPFGPFLALGGLVALLAGEPMVDWYLRTFA
jgi:prepilin signal peptidase PulO-like enzyme (type II secretory pathway)